MSLASEDIGDARVITISSPRIDAAMAIQFKEEMRRETQGSCGRVVLNLTQVDFIDSSGLGAVVASMKLLEEDRRMDLAGLTPNVRKVFRLTRMDTVFRLFDTLDEAIADRTQ